jgi:hypothetical protein
MIIRLNAALRRRPGHGERGAGTLESVGMYAVAAIFAAGVVLAALGSSPVVRDKFRQAVCMLTTLGQGECGSSVTSAADRVPTEPCVLSAQGHTGAVEGGVFLTSGRSEQFLVEKLSNGQFRVTRDTGGKLNAGIGVGQGFSVTWDNHTVGSGARADISVGATFAEGQAFYANNMDEVNYLLKAHKEAATKELVSRLGPGGRLGTGVVNRLQERFHLGNPLPTPEETFSEGGPNANAMVQAGQISSNQALNAQAGIGAQAILGTRRGRDGTSTTYFQTSVDGNISASAWVGGRLDINQGITATAGVEVTGDGKGEAVVEVERDGKGIITAVRLKTTLAGAADVTGTAGQVSASKGVAHYGEMVVALPINNSSDQEIAQRYLNALGMGPMGGFNDLPRGVQNYLPIPNPSDALAATKAFAQAAGDRGLVTKNSFEVTESSTSGANFGVDIKGLPVGAGVKVDSVNRRSTGAEFYDGKRFVPREGCGAK